MDKEGYVVEKPLLWGAIFYSIFTAFIVRVKPCLACIVTFFSCVLMIDLDTLSPLAHAVFLWINQNLFAWHAIVQAGAIIGILLLAYGGAQKLSSITQRKLSLSVNKVKILTCKDIFFILLVLLGWCIVATMEEIRMPYRLVEMFASIATAGMIAHFIAYSAKNHLVLHVCVLLVWGVTTLKIVGLLDTLTHILRKVSFSLGSLEISLYALIEGSLTLVVALWLAKVLSRLVESYIMLSEHITASQKVLFSKLQKMLFIGAACVLTLHVVGISLAAFAVLGGAVGLGVGFGMQKVISNLVSGIILLLDKSIKPGDVIAVGDKYGWVNALGARYISIITRDGKEHLIPNEVLITETVENWSYSHNNVRVHIPIGVSYKSDLHKARELLLAAVKEHPRTLSNPEPSCILTGFGDNSVNLDLRLWINDPTEGVGNIQSDILFAIWDKFHLHGIELPFPQRDLHIKPSEEFLDALMERLVKLKGEPSP